MSDMHEREFIGLQGHEQFIRTSADFITALRLVTRRLKVSEAEYSHFEDIAAEVMRGIITVYEKLVSELSHEQPEQIRRMALAKDSVQEGLAELVADSQDGMEHRQFVIELNSWKKLWHSQLRVS